MTPDLDEKAKDNDKEYYLIYPYNENGARGRVVRLIERHVRSGSRLVDLGAGAGVIAQPLVAQGYDYFGLETHPGALHHMSKVGIKNAYCNLADLEQVAARLNELDNTGAYCLLDVIEHLPDPQHLLNFLSERSLQLEQAPWLVVSVPNVTHYDVGLNLLLGHWDVREAGLLDAEHVRFFTEKSLETVLANCGWELVEREDYPLPNSDQYQPALVEQLPPSDRQRLQTIAQAFNPTLTINQFVWILRPVAVAGTKKRPETFWQAYSNPTATLAATPTQTPTPAIARLQENELSRQKSDAELTRITTELVKAQTDLTTTLEELEKTRAELIKTNEAYTGIQTWANKLNQDYQELEKWANQLQTRQAAPGDSGLLTRLQNRLKPKK